MFEGLNMTRKLKRRFGSAISVVLSAAMLVTGLPADLLGGLASVKAAEAGTYTENASADQYVEFSQTDWGGLDVSSQLQENQRATSWDFITKVKQSQMSGGLTLKKGESVKGIGIVSGGKDLSSNSDKNVSIKKYDSAKDANMGISIYGDGCIAVPLDKDAEKVTVSLWMGSTSSGRNITIGNESTKEVVKHSSLQKATSLTNIASYSHEFDESYMSVAQNDTKWLYITSGRDEADTSSGESKIWKIKIVETKSASSDDDPAEPKDPAELGTNDGIDPGEVGDITWTFPVKTEDNGVTIEGKTGNYRGLKVDATTGKFSVRASDVQFNTGAKIQVPVDGDCEITVTASSGAQYALYTVNGEAASTTALSDTFTYKGDKGYVDIVSTGSAYIKSIAVKHSAKGEEDTPAEPKDPAELGTNDGIDPGEVGDITWTFPVKAEDNGVTIEGKTGNYRGLKVDATTGKFSVRASDVQFNTGAKIQVPVDGDCEITVTASSGAQYALYTVNGEAASTAALSDTFTYKGDKGYVDIVSTGSAYIKSIAVKHSAKEERPNFDPKVPDVWDFGAGTVEGANNLLTADIINSLYPGVAPGTANTNILSFTLKDGNGKDAVKFVTDKTNNRLRSTNTALTRYDDKELTDADKNVYTGYLYSNNGSTDKTRLEFYLYAGDTLTCMLGSNGNTATYNFAPVDGEVCAAFDYEKTAGVEKAVFHAAEDGWYKLWCTNEKLVCARITREHAPIVTVSGSIDTDKAAGLPDGYKLLFTNQTTKAVTEMTVDGKSYSGELYGGYLYKASLSKEANGYVVKTGNKLELGTDEAKVIHDISIETVDKKKITGTITGLSDEALQKLQLEFEVPEDYVYEPELTIDRAQKTYTLYVENGVTYKVTAVDVNDYELEFTEISATADTNSKEIKFTEKTKYDVTLTIKCDELDGFDASKAKVTFTNIDETYSDGKTPYTYAFDSVNGIKLRDGRYSVKVTGLANYPVRQGLTKNVNVNGAAVSGDVPFKVITDGWDFAILNDTTEIETIDDVQYIAGLKLEGTINKNKTYLLGNSGSTVTIPNLKAGDKLTFTYCYLAAFKVDGQEICTNSNDTKKLETFEYTVKSDGEVTLENTTLTPGTHDGGKSVSQTYLCSIKLLRKADMVEYKAQIEVGKDKTYKTINEALDAVKKMDRTADQRVTIMIQPGNYEEMLDIDVPNVTLKNAAASPSIALKNKGVDIDDNAVRVTWYYGHGYTYYSMGSDCKYDAELLEVNKANGYASFTNPGTGTTNGSYWNATVTVQADGFRAEGIIFENSFNQYMSAKAVEDEIVKQEGAAKEGSVARAEMKYGDTTVQDKAYVERAAALAIYDNIDKVYFENCKFIGRQDTLYGGKRTKAAFYDCSVYGGTDYIFGGMTAVFAKCDLVFNTSDSSNDVGYITAAQTDKDCRGLLMWNCTVTSTEPGVDTASQYPSKAGGFGRPWSADTGEAVFYETIVDATCSQYFKAEPSMIMAAGWSDSLSGKSAKSMEYHTHERAMDVITGKELDNSAKRVSWATQLTVETAKDITVEAFLGDWDAFAGKDMAVKVPEDMGTVNNMPVGNVKIKNLRNLGADKDGKGQVELTWDALLKAEADAYELVVTEKDAKDAAITETIENKDGEGTMSKTLTNLTVGSTYTVSLTAVRGQGDAQEKGETDAKEIEVKAEADKTLTDPKYELSITTDGLKQGVNYEGGFSVLEDMPAYGGSTASDKVVAGVTYSVWVQGTNNPKPNKGEVPTEGTALILDAWADGAVSIICANNGKNVNFVDGTDGTAILKEDPWADKVYEFEVKKDHKYYFYASGSKLMLCAASVQYKGEVTPPITEDPEPSDPSARTEWSKVEAPVITSVAYTENTNKIVVKAKGDVSDKGADSLKVIAKRQNGKEYEAESKEKTSAEQTFTFEVSNSGSYTVTAYLVRAGEADKAGESKTVEVKLPAELEETGLHVELVDGDEYTYTGTAQTPAIEVTNNGELLTEGVDYTVKYKNNVNAADKGIGKKAPSITVTGKGNLSGSNTATFTIKPRSLDDVTVGAIVVASNSKATPVLVYNGVKLGNKDFENPSASMKFTEDATITVTGKGNYEGELVIPVTVVPKSELKKFNVKVGKEKLTFDPNNTEALRPTITVNDKASKADLIEDQDYTIVYNSDGLNAGTVKFTVIGLGLYSGSVTKTYKINPLKADASQMDVAGIDEQGYTFKSSGVTLSDDLTVTYKAETDFVLEAGKDYKLSYSNNKKVGVNKAKVTVTFLGNYKGTKAIKKTFTINPAPLMGDDVKVTSADKVYTGKPGTYVSKPIVTVDGVALKTSDYTVKYYREDGTEINNRSKLEVAEGSAKVEVRVTGKGNYAPTDSETYVSGYYNVTVVSDKKTQDLSKAKVTLLDQNGAKIKKLEYTGEAVSPASVQVELKGKTLVEGVDYTVECVNNVNKGKATAVINAVDGSGYGGGKMVKYSIIAESLKNLTDLFR